MKTTTIPLELLDIEGEGYHLTFHVHINDKLARLVLDTGASRTVFDSNCLNSFFDRPKLIAEERMSTGVGSNEIASYSFNIDDFKIGSIHLKNYNAAVLDLKHVTESYEKVGLGDVHAVFGGDLLLKFQAVIDYKKLTLSLREITDE